MNISAKFIWAGLGPSDQAAELRRLKDQGLDWEYIHFILNSRKVAQLFYSELERRGEMSLLPDWLARDLQSTYQRVAAKNLMLFHDLVELLGVLNERDIPCLVMKGGALVMQGVFKLGERILADIDLLIRPEHFEEVINLMKQNLGYSELKLSDAAPWQELHMVNPNNSHIEIHVEMRPVNGLPPNLVMDRIWSRARVMEYKGQRAMVPAHEDLLLQDAVHASMHHLFSLEYLFPAVPDMARIIEKWGQDMDWAELLRIAANERSREHFLVLLLLAERIFPGTRLADAGAAVGELLPHWDEPYESLAESLLEMMMQREPISLDYLVYFLARTSWREKMKTLKRMLLSGRQERYVELEDQTFNFPCPGPDDKFKWRFRKLRPGYLRFFYQMARFYRSFDYFPPG